MPPEIGPDIVVFNVRATPAGKCFWYSYFRRKRTVATVWMVS